MGNTSTSAGDYCLEGEKDATKNENKHKRRKRSMRNKLLVTLFGALVTATLGLAMGQASGPNVWTCLLSACFYFSLIVNAGWAFCILTPYVGSDRRLVNAIIFTILFIWGCVFYFFAPVEDEGGGGASLSSGNVVFDRIARQIAAPNRTLAAFFPSRGGFESVPKGSGKEGWRIHYFVFHSVVIFYIALLMFAILGRGIVNRMNKWFIRWKRLNVFWGRSDAGLLLARSIIDSTVGDQVFFVLQQKSGDGDEWRTLTKEIDQMGAMWTFSYDSNAVESDVSRDALAQAKGRRHFFMDESGHVNLSRADRLVKVLRDKKPGPGLRGFCTAVRAGVFRWWLSAVVKWAKAVDMRSRGGDSGNGMSFTQKMLWWVGRGVDGMPSPPVFEKPYFYVRVDASADEFVYLEWAANVRDVVNPVLIKESRRTAKDFISKYPMLDMPGIKVDTTKAVVSSGRFSVLIVGFGAVGQSILHEVVCNGQFLGPDGKEAPFAVDVVEQDPKVIDEFCIRHPEVGLRKKGKYYDVRFVKGVRIEDRSFDKWFKSRLKDYGRIIICLKGDESTLSAAYKIVEFARRFGVAFPKGTVFARVKDPARSRYVPYVRPTMFNIYRNRDKKSVDRPITLFGNLEDIYSFRQIKAEDVDKMAKILNTRYVSKIEIGPKAEEDWDKASIFNQLSSRASAEGQRNLLRLLGWKCVAQADESPAVSQEKLSVIKDEHSDVLLTLAKTEHLRWNAYHRMLGYRRWNVLDVDAEYENVPEPKPPRDAIKANQLETIGKHADIVPFDDLPDVDVKIARWKTGRCDLKREDYVGLHADCAQAWDIAFCQIMDEVAAAAGMKIVEMQGGACTRAD